MPFTRNILLAVVLLFACNSFAQTSPNKGQALTLARMLEEFHVSPRAIDDKFSEQVFSQFIKKLDKHHLYFTASDIKELSAYLHKIDDELQGKAAWEFLNKATSLYKYRLQQADTIINSTLKKPFDLSVAESIQLPPDSADFDIDNKAHRARWNKWLKYQTLRKLAEIVINDTVNKGAAARTNAMKQEPALREKVKAAQLRKNKKILDHPWGYENYIASIFCNAVTACYDPHTVYMPPVEKERFEGAVTGVQYSFGLELDESEQGDIVISHLVPGGPAWKTGELNKDDVLIKLKWDKKPEVDLTAADIEDVEEMLQGLNHDRLELTVKKPNGVEKTVTLLKEKLREDENFVKSFVLNGEKKIGYISLPGFYTQWENEAGSSCANDVAKEIIKLKEEKIDGLLLDLRSNGGGSLQEAIDMAGIFIEEGPMCMVKGQDGKAKSYKDLNRGTIYDGPLVVMVNGQSASASEVLAGALQDYNRAVITGSSTFGKATVQVVLPVDTTLFDLRSAMSNWKKQVPLGYVSLTIQKLYRVNGSTNQCYGLRPDVQLPDIFSKLNYRESAYPFVLPPDSVKKNNYYTPLKALPVQQLAQKSMERVNASKDFRSITEVGDMLGELDPQKMRSVPLKWEEYLAVSEKRSAQLEKLVSTIEGPKTGEFTVDNNSFDKDRINSDPYRRELNTTHLGNIGTDIYISESFRIITDYINSLK